jgi:hypothetical protein
MRSATTGRPDVHPRAGTRSTKEDAYPEGRDGLEDGPEGELDDPEGRLKGPHERDESSGSMEPGTDRESGRRAYEDLAAGRTDTDLRGSAREIIERAQATDADTANRQEQARGKPASEGTPPDAPAASQPDKEQKA